MSRSSVLNDRGWNSALSFSPVSLPSVDSDRPLRKERSMILRGMPVRSNPVAMTVILNLSFRSGSITAPKIRLTSGWAVSLMMAAA